MTIVYDLSRLAFRFTRPAPNGIDRIDLAGARHFLSLGDTRALVLTALGPRIVKREAARCIVEELAKLWREAEQVDHDPVFVWLRRALVGSEANTEAAGAGKTHQQASSPRPPPVPWLGALGRVAMRAPLFGAGGLFPGGDPSRKVPRDAVLINFSQFPSRLPAAWRWLEARRDLRTVFLVHDLLPVSHPEFFPPAEREQHRRFLSIAARHGRLLVVTTEAVRCQLSAHLSSENLPRPQIEVIGLAVDPIFYTPAVLDPGLFARSYFVVCGTIEPRKNHLMLLNVWRELACKFGTDTPKLVMVGTRGWRNHNVIDMLERCELVRPHVIEVAGLSTPGLKRLLDNAKGMLMPTFAEGFGLPVAEAFAAGVPVVSTRIPALEGAARDVLACLDPLDGTGWLNAISQLMQANRVVTLPRTHINAESASKEDFTRRLERIIAVL